ncbi:DEAD/DEAH box helicase [Ruania suaedae]|uniref:helicase-related protein n=1 Tax=Ruania suaedae TaxID=2897774 RepID=UPI001E652FB1|nr:helicase-related protein [Ruania suaedae]UFU01877.1 DEAD/DEAH box helicase [Ruania suaedae]
MSTSTNPPTAPARPDSGPRPFTGAPGSVMVARDEEWLVTAVEPAAPDPATNEPTYFVHGIGLTGITKDTEAVFWTQIDPITLSDPRATQVVGDDSPGHRRSRLWLEAILRKTPVPIAEPGLTTAHQALADPLEYQYAAVRKALDPENLRPRILLADAVGLGKTLEIGMILAELVRRGRGDRILVVTPKHVLEQMQFELWTRFALPFVRLDSTGIQRIRQKLPAGRNPFTFFKRVIISIDTLKSDKYINHLRRHRWDAVVIDESHNVTNTASQNNRLASLLSQRTDALILASATPHNGRKESFNELIRMLEPSAVTPEGDLVPEQVERLIIRRHRHHPDVAGVVGADWAERQPPNNRLVPASDIENEIAAELEHTWLWPATGASPYSGTNKSLFPWTLAKAFLSSPAALAQTVTERIRRLGTNPTVDQQRELTALSNLADLAERAENGTSAKYDALVDHLTQIGIARTAPTRVVVFAERIATLHWLQQRLTRDLRLAADQVQIMHGGLTDEEQQDLVESFKLGSSPIRVLVTGDVASEGVNLHTQCHHLVHFDIPWSLIRIEQRNGRIDRYGQKHRPQITTLLLSPSTERFGGDIRVLTRLVEREHEAHTALGDSASLMGNYDVKREEDAIREVLAGTKELDDVVRTVEEVRQADDVEGFLARLMAVGSSEQPTTAKPTSTGQVTTAATTAAMYDDARTFLEDALEEFVLTPGAPPPNGVAWQMHPRHGIASMDLSGKHTRDLRQRLEVLPQSYLRQRRVTETFRLATTPAAGTNALIQARQDESTSTWPEAHYLAPLHPVLEWAADRSLAALGRDQVFAVRGDVEDPTVLLQATLTNARGQVIATSYTHVAFPAAPSTAQAYPQPFPSAQAAINDLALADVNTGAVPGAARLQPFIAAAVDAATQATALQIDAIADATRDRIQRWRDRSERWLADSHALVQRSELKSRTRLVAEEEELAQQMNPERTLVRPLLVVVPNGDIDHLLPASQGGE